MPRFAPLPFAWPERSRLFVVARDIRLRDAVGNFCLQLAELFEGAGIEVVLVAENRSDGLADRISDPASLQSPSLPLMVTRRMAALAAESSNVLARRSPLPERRSTRSLPASQVVLPMTPSMTVEMSGLA